MMLIHGNRARLTLMRTPLRMRMPLYLSFLLAESLTGVAFCCFFWTFSCFFTTSSFSPAQCSSNNSDARLGQVQSKGMHSNSD